MRVRFAPLVLIVSLISLPVPLLSQTFTGVDGSQPQRVPSFPALEQALQLSPDQVATLQGLMAGLEEQLRPVFQRLGEVSLGLQEAVTAGSPDATVVGTLFLEIQRLQTQIPEIRAEYREQALLSLNLSAAQQDKLQAIAQSLTLLNAASEATLLNLIDNPEFPGLVPTSVIGGIFGSIVPASRICLPSGPGSPAGPALPPEISVHRSRSQGR